MEPVRAPVPSPVPRQGSTVGQPLEEGGGTGGVGVCRVCSYCARWVIKRTELTCACLSIVYLGIIASDLIISELVGDQCEGVTEGQRQWSQIYGLLDLSFLIFFSCEILLHLIADGVG